VRHLQENGGSLSAPSGVFEIRAGDFDVSVVYVAPLPGVAAPAFEEATAAFAEVRVSAVSADRADTVAQHAQTLLAASH
jgi:hypothetical protein